MHELIACDGRHPSGKVVQAATQHAVLLKVQLYGIRTYKADSTPESHGMKSHASTACSCSQLC